MAVMDCDCAHTWSEIRSHGNDHEYQCSRCGRTLERSEDELAIYCREEGRRMVIACTWPNCVVARRTPWKRTGDRLRRVFWYIDSLSDGA
jgi:hypothetical protein